MSIIFSDPVYPSGLWKSAPVGYNDLSAFGDRNNRRHGTISRGQTTYYCTTVSLCEVFCDPVIESIENR